MSVKHKLKKIFLRPRCWYCGEYAPMWHEGVGGGGSALYARDVDAEWNRHKDRCERNFSFTAFYPPGPERLPFGQLQRDEMPQRRLV